MLSEGGGADCPPTLPRSGWVGVVGEEEASSKRFSSSSRYSPNKSGLAGQPCVTPVWQAKMSVKPSCVTMQALSLRYVDCRASMTAPVRPLSCNTCPKRCRGTGSNALRKSSKEQYSFLPQCCLVCSTRTFMTKRLSTVRGFSRNPACSTHLLGFRPCRGSILQEHCKQLGEGCSYRDTPIIVRSFAFPIQRLHGPPRCTNFQDSLVKASIGRQALKAWSTHVVH